MPEHNVLEERSGSSEKNKWVGATIPRGHGVLLDAFLANNPHAPLYGGIQLDASAEWRSIRGARLEPLADGARFKDASKLRVPPRRKNP